MRECAALPGVVMKTGTPVAGRVNRRAWLALSTALLAAVLCVGAVASRPLAAYPRPAARIASSADASSSAGAWAQLSPLARLAISRGVGADEPSYWARRSGGDLVARNPAQRLRLRFASTGVTVTAAAGSFSLALRLATGNGRRLAAPAVVPQATQNRVSYRRSAITEWYANGPSGLEQGFTVAGPAASGASRSLVLSLNLQTGAGLQARAAGGGVNLLSHRNAVLRYGGLSAVDAHGRALAAWMSLRGSRLVLHVRTTHAAFPVRIDPIIQDATLTAGDGADGDELGQAVAVSGPLVAVGAPDAAVDGQADAGAVYLFSQPSGGWANASSAVKLTSAAPAANDQLGAAVAIAGDTVLAGAPGNGTAAGSVFYFAKPAGGWTSGVDQGQLTSPNSGADGFGTAIAASGNTLVVGAPFARSISGAAYVFTEPPGGWAPESPAATLTTTASGAGGLGASVAIGGSTIVAGAPFADGFEGELMVYSEPPDGWTSASQTAALSECDSSCPANLPVSASFDGLGASVGLDGSTVVGGAPGAQVNGNSEQGAVYVFSEPASGGWADASATVALTAANGQPGDGLGSAVSVAGSTIFAGAPSATVDQTVAQGAVSVFGEPAGGWVTASSSTSLSEAAGDAGDGLGNSIAVSGASLVVGANAATVTGPAGQGAAVLFGSTSGDIDDDSGTTTTSTTTTSSATTSTANPSTTPAVTAPTTTVAASTSRAATVVATRNYATVTGISGGPGSATVALKCTATSGKCTAANVQLVIKEQLSGNRLVGTEASTKLHLKSVVIGAGHVTLAAGAHAALKVSLNATGHSLLGSHTRMVAGVSVTSIGRTLRLDTVTITRPVAANRQR